MAQAQPPQGNAQTEKSGASRVSPAELNVPQSGTQKITPEQQTGDSGSAAKEPTHNPFWAEWVMAIATVVYSFFAILQWRALRRTVDETQSLVRTSTRQAQAAEQQVTNLERTLAATQVAANAAKENADTAEKTLRLAERAWVSIQADRLDDLTAIERWRDVDVSQMPDDFRLMVAIKYRFINSGKTPARLTHSGAKFKTVIEKELPNDFGAMGYQGGSDRLVIVAPNQPYEVAKVTFLNIRSIENLLAGVERLAFYGFVRYLDVLDNSHETRFCMMATFRKGEPPTFGVDGPPSYNYFD